MKHRQHRRHRRHKRSSGASNRLSSRASARFTLPFPSTIAFAGTVALLFSLRLFSERFSADQTLLASLWTLAGASVGFSLSYLVSRTRFRTFVTRLCGISSGILLLTASVYLYFWGLPSEFLIIPFLTIYSATLTIMLSSGAASTEWQSHPRHTESASLLLGVTSALALNLAPVNWLSPPLALLGAGALTLITPGILKKRSDKPAYQRPSILAIAGIVISLTLISIVSQRADNSTLYLALNSRTEISAHSRPLWSFEGLFEIEQLRKAPPANGVAKACAPAQEPFLDAHLTNRSMTDALNSDHYLHDQKYIAAQLYDNPCIIGLGAESHLTAAALSHFSESGTDLNPSHTIPSTINQTALSAPRDFLEQGNSLYDLALAPEPAALSSDPSMRKTERLHTVEGYSAALRRLQPNGLLSFSWIEDNSTWPLYYRTLYTLYETLRNRSNSAVSSHLCILRNKRPELPALITTLVSPTPLQPEMIESLKDIATAEGFEILVLSGESNHELVAEALGVEASFHATQISSELGVTFTPLTDDQPFAGIFPIVAPQLVRPVFADRSSSFSSHLQNASRIDLFGATIERYKALQASFYRVTILPVAVALLFALIPIAGRRVRVEFKQSSVMFITISLLCAAGALSFLGPLIGAKLGADSLLSICFSALIGSALYRVITTAKHRNSKQLSHSWLLFAIVAPALGSATLWLSGSSNLPLLSLQGLLLGLAFSAMIVKLSRQADSATGWILACAVSSITIAITLAIWLTPYTGLKILPAVAAALFTVTAIALYLPAVAAALFTVTAIALYLPFGSARTL